MKLDKLFFLYKKCFFLKKRKYFSSIFRRSRNFHRLLSFYSKFGVYYYPKKRLLYTNLLFSRYFRRKTFIYLKPFFINRIFFSKLFGAKLIKRLANVW